MRNYVIINGVNSTTIQGLAINILPPITKPMIRTQIEEIDGRDGDLVTELGYSAYDKTMEIGLWGTYDIDAIIKYFTGEGTIVFSTEPDKYYYFKILNQIDYEKLLKFKTATVTFHCQPYKYPTSETPLEEQYEYVEETGTDLTLNNTEETIFNKFDLIGNTYQFSTTGKNKLFIQDKSSTTTNGITYSVKDGVITLSGTSTAGTTIYFETNLNTLNTLAGSQAILTREILSGTWNFEFDIGKPNEHYYWQITGNQTGTIASQVKNQLETLTMKPHLYIGANKTLNCSFRVQAEAGGTFTTYEPYTGGIPAPNPDFPEDIHVVSGDNTIEICGKNLFDGVWESGTINNTTGQEQSGNNVRRTKNYIKIQPNTTYTISRTTTPTNTMPLRYYDMEKVFIGSAVGITATDHVTITTPNNAYYVRFVDFENNNAQVMLELGNQVTTFEAYQGASYPISLGVENLSPISSMSTTNGGYINSSTGQLGNVVAGKTYTVQFKNNSSYTNQIDVRVFHDNTYTSQLNKNLVANGIVEFTFTASNTGYIAINGRVASDMTDIFTEIQTTKGSTPQRVSTTPLEMCSIPNTDYKDTFVHEDNKWYKYAMVGKQTFNGSEVSSWSSYEAGGGGYKRIWRTIPNSPTELSPRTMIISNYFKYNDNYATDNIGVGFISQAKLFVYPLQQDSKDNFMTWLGTHNTDLYYPLLNPTQTEITDETLKAQLDDLWENAISYKGQTNITQTNNDLPFIMDVSALKDGSDHLIINNIGTAYSKPTIDIEGTGIVDIYLNDEQIFEIDLTTQNEIIIDTEKMEAYTPDNTLANRLVTGDYSNFKLAPGENDLRFSGDLTKATVTRYIRWI